MGGAQPLAVTMNEGACLIVDVDPARLHRRVEHRYLDEVADDLDDAVEKALTAKQRAARPGRSASSATPPRSSPSCCAAACRSTSSPTRPPRTTRCPTCPEGVALEDWHDYAEKKPEEFTDRARASMAKHVQAMVEFQDAGAEVFDYGNSIRDEARQGGYDRAFEFPGFVPGLHPAAVLRGQGPVPLGGALGRPARTSPPPTRPCSTCSPTTTACTSGSAARRSGSPSRACRPASAGSATASATRRGWRSTSWSAPGRSARPIVIGRDHLDTGSVASPYRETESMARRLRRHRRLAAAQRAGQHRARARPGSRSTTAAASASAARLHAGQVSLADGTDLAAQKLARVLTNDPGMGVIRHVDAGYDIADRVAAERGVRIPMQES